MGVFPNRKLFNDHFYNNKKNLLLYFYATSVAYILLYRVEDFYIDQDSLTTPTEWVHSQIGLLADQVPIKVQKNKNTITCKPDMSVWTLWFKVSWLRGVKSLATTPMQRAFS